MHVEPIEVLMQTIISYTLFLKEVRNASIL